MQHITVQHSTAQYSKGYSTVKGTVRTVQHSTAQYSTAQYSTVQHSTAQYSTAQHSTVQYSTAQYSKYSTVNGTVQYSTVQDRTVQYSTTCNRCSTAQYRTEQTTVPYRTDNDAVRSGKYTFGTRNAVVRCLYPRHTLPQVCGQLQASRLPTVHTECLE